MSRESVPFSGKRMNDTKYVDRWWQNLKARIAVDQNGCWLWQGFVHPNGYGKVNLRGYGNLNIHRAVWIMKNGSLRTDQYVCHRCDVKRCCNPDHLWLGTPKDNIEDRDEKRRNFFANKTHCKRGHKFTPENTRMRKAYRDRAPARVCRECERARHRRGFRKHDVPPQNPAQSEYQRRYREKLKQRAAV